MAATLAACTTYQPVAWDGSGSWEDARSASQLGSAETPLAQPDPAGTSRRLVLPGETLSEIAEEYGLTSRELASINGVSRPDHIVAGQVLRVPRKANDGRPDPSTALASRDPVPKRPGAPDGLEPGVSNASVTVQAAPMSDSEIDATRRAAATPPPSLSGEGFLWPVRGAVIATFGAKANGSRNDGVDIAAPAGTPVLAAENGIVVYAGSAISGYGLMLLIRHGDGYTTAYAHNASLLVGVGDAVQRGQQIARVGDTGGVARPQLHFEIRSGKTPLDPVRHLERDETEVASVQ